MATEYKLNVSKAMLAQASAEFYHFYGHAMARWASLERSLYYWFRGSTGMQDGMARAIFYGARGFGARAEMLEAAIEHATVLDPTQLAFIKEALKKARNYSAFRNKMAHGDPQPNLTHSNGNVTAIHYTIVQGSDPAAAGDKPLSIEDLDTAAENITTLHYCIMDMIPWFRAHGVPKSAEECLALVRGLPNQPNDKSARTPSGASQPPQGRQPRNKKAYRASQQTEKPKPPRE
jgi:hypothetical protein